MLFNPWTFVFEVLNFVVLVVILERLVYRPLRRAIDERREAIARSQAEAEAASRDAADLQQQLSVQRAAIEQEREHMLQQASEAIAAERARAAADAIQEAERRRLAVEHDLEELQRTTVAVLRADVVAMSVEVVERLLREISDTTLDQQLCRHLVEMLAGARALERTGLPPGWDPGDGVVVEAAGEVDDATLGDLKAAVSAYLRREAPILVERRPDLISGARLDIGGRVWDASLAGLLYRLRQTDPEEVTHDGARYPAPPGVA